MNAFKDFKSRAETLIKKKIKYLQSDNGKEYRNKISIPEVKRNKSPINDNTYAGTERRCRET